MDTQNHTNHTKDAKIFDILEASDDAGEAVCNTCELVQEGGHMVIQLQGDETGVREAVESFLYEALCWVD